jgi:hypothetical protein
VTRNQLHAHSSQPWRRPRSAAYKSRAGNSGHLDLVRNKKRAGRDKARATPRFIGASRRFSRVEREASIGLAFPRPRLNPGSITAFPRAGAQ